MHILKSLWHFIKNLFFTLWDLIFKKEMKHICYLYIKKYKILENIGILLDSNYSIALDNKSRVLHIAKNDSLPKNFWGSGIYSIAGIFGNNGSGKSTALSCLMDLLLEGSAIRSFDGILVYEYEGTLYVYQNLHEGEALIESRGIQIKPLSKIKKLDVFYYSGHFMPYMNADDQRCRVVSNAKVYQIII